MAITCYLSGRLGNIVFSQAQMIAYAKKHDLSYYVPTEAIAYRHFRNDITNPLLLPSTGAKPVNPIIYDEPGNKKTENPQYFEIPKMDNIMLRGYFQSFLYFDWCRDHILQTFNVPYQMEAGMTAISVRRGDCLRSPEAFPIAPKEYYVNAVDYMNQRGFNKFRVYSDDIEWCKKNFTVENFPDSTFEFSEGQTEVQNWASIACCENQITARSTFSLTAAWFNRNPNKIVCVPTYRHRWWRSVNKDLLTGTDFIQIDFQNITDEWSK